MLCSNHQGRAVERTTAGMEIDLNMGKRCLVPERPQAPEDGDGERRVNSRGRMREPCIAKGSPVTPLSEARELILIWTARNTLKSPESDEEIQENPSSFSWSGLVGI